MSSIDGDLLDAVRALKPQVELIQDQLDDARSLPPSLLRELRDMGIFESFYPRVRGGHQLKPTALYRIVEEISTADGAVGWCAMVTSVFSIVTGWLADEEAQAMFGRPPDVRIAGSFQPTGRADRVEKGFRVSGRWTFASGIDYANWIFCPCKVSGDPKVRAMFVPKEDVTVLDTWRVLGMRATGSHDFVVQDQFVPEERTVCLGDRPEAKGALYDPRFLLAFAWVPVAAVSMGIARGAMETLVELATKSGSNLSSTLLRDRSSVQRSVARAEAIIDSARAYLMNAASDAWKAVDGQVTDPLGEFAHLHLATAQACHEAVRAVEILFEAAGTNAIYESNGLERSLRDVRVAAQHRAGHEANVELAGRVLLGLRPEGWE